MINLILLAIFAFIIGGGLINRFLRRRSQRRKPAHAVTVTVEDEHFTVVEGKTCVSVHWGDITRITAITTNDGPWLDDLFYHVVYAGGDLTLPSEANGVAAFVDKLRTLPGFDNEALGRANGSAQNNSFVVVLRNETAPA